MPAETDIQFLRRAIRLAMNGRGITEPNPSVGCVLVKEGRVIGEGHTQAFGGPHAEPTALASCTESPEGATAYVTLEPCCHTNKKTPPCVPKLIEAKIARVVIGCLDPNPDVDGKGIAMLREAGIEVVAPVLENEARQLIAPFIARTVHSRPYITLKWAQSADGKIAGPNGARLQISNEASTRAVHQLRARCEAILVGVNTVIADDPLLTARGVEHSRLRDRIILDSHLRTPPTSRIVQSNVQSNDGGVDIYFTAESYGSDQMRTLMKAGINLCISEPDDVGRISIPRLIARKNFNDITHLLVEPGPTLAQSFFDAGAADRVWIIRSPNAINAADAPNAPKLPSRYVETGQAELDGDVLTEYLDRESDLYFAAEASSDLALRW